MQEYEHVQGTGKGDAWINQIKEPLPWRNSSSTKKEILKLPGSSRVYQWKGWTTENSLLLHYEGDKNFTYKLYMRKSKGWLHLLPACQCPEALESSWPPWHLDPLQPTPWRAYPCQPYWCSTDPSSWRAPRHTGRWCWWSWRSLCWTSPRWTAWRQRWVGSLSCREAESWDSLNVPFILS